MPSTAKTVDEYLRSLPEDRRKSISIVRSVIKKNLPAGYQEGMGYGMIGYVVPSKMFPQGYLGQKDVPLIYVALGNQKNYMSLYLMNVYGNTEIAEWFKRNYVKGGFKLDMGKSCVRFKSADQLNLSVIGQVIRKTSVQQYIAAYQAAHP
jgi:hypothetical protein